MIEHKDNWFLCEYWITDRIADEIAAEGGRKDITLSEYEKIWEFYEKQKISIGDGMELRIFDDAHKYCICDVLGIMENCVRCELFAIE